MALDNPAYSRQPRSSLSQGAVATQPQDISAQQLEEMYNQPATPPAGETDDRRGPRSRRRRSRSASCSSARPSAGSRPSRLPFLWIGRRHRRLRARAREHLQARALAGPRARLRGRAGHLRRRHLGVLRDALRRRHRRPGRHRDARRGRRDARPVRLAARSAPRRRRPRSSSSRWSATWSSRSSTWASCSSARPTTRGACARVRDRRHPARTDPRRARRHHGGVLARARLRLHPAGRAQPRPEASSSGLGVFGIMVTVIWLYLEILRMLAIAQSSD